jgi:hypothetical protein
VPGGEEILDLWAETLGDLERGDIFRLAPRLDWALKWILVSEIRPRPDDLGDARCRLADLLYGHVDDREGLFWKFWREGLVERSIDDDEIGRWMFAGDPRTRSGLRGELIARLSPWIIDMDWSFVEFLQGRERGGTRSWRIEMPDPSAPSGSVVQAMRERFPREEDLLDRLFDAAAAAGGRLDGTRLEEDLRAAVRAGAALPGKAYAEDGGRR